MVPISSYLALSAALFVIGLVGFVVRRNAIVVFMCVELMLNAVNIAFVALAGGTACVGAEACQAARLDGQIAVFFVMVVAAAEAAVGLAVVIAMFRTLQSVETDRAAELRG